MFFIADEAYMKSTGGFRSSCPNYPPVPKNIVDLIVGALKEGISLMAIDKETNKIVGLRVQFTLER